MKKFILLAIIATFLPTSIICFCLGRNYENEYYGQKYYEDACHMSDLIRHFNDYTTTDNSLFKMDSIHYLSSYNIDLSDYVWEY